MSLYLILEKKNKLTVLFDIKVHKSFLSIGFIIFLFTFNKFVSTFISIDVIIVNYFRFQYIVLLDYF